MIWKDYLKLSEIASYSKLARASKAPTPIPTGGIRLIKVSMLPDVHAILATIFRSVLTTFKVEILKIIKNIESQLKLS